MRNGCSSKNSARTRRAQAEAAYRLGQLAESRIDYAKAAKYYGEAVALQPDNALYLGAKGVIAYMLGRYEEARVLLERCSASEEGS